MLQLIPDVPRTARGWALLVFVGTPVYVALGLLVEKAAIPKWGWRISSARFSVVRILVGVVLVSVVVLPLALAWWYLQEHFLR